MKRNPLSLGCLLTALLSFAPSAQAIESMSPDVEDLVVENAQEALAELDQEDGTLPDAQDFAEALADAERMMSSDGMNEGDTSSSPSSAHAAKDHATDEFDVQAPLNYRQVPLYQRSEPPHRVQARRTLPHPLPKAQKPVNRTPKTFGGPIRLELGLGWNVGSTKVDGSRFYSFYDSDIQGFGPTGFIALKFRPSQRAPLLLGVEASTAFHPWNSGGDGGGCVEGSADFYSACLEKNLAVMADVTLSIYPTRSFYFMFGAGFTSLSLQYDYEHRTEASQDVTTHDFGYNFLAALGIEVPVTDVFRMGFQLRAVGGILEDHYFGQVSGFLILSLL